MRNAWGKELKFPDQIYYTPELLWIKNESEGKLRMGISDLGVKAVKQLLHIRIKSRLGDQISKGDMIGLVETSKMVWEIVAPISGVVVAVNRKVSQGNPNTLMGDPYGEGWLIDIEKTNQTDSELKELHWGEEPKTREWIRDMVQANVPLMEES